MALPWGSDGLLDGGDGDGVFCDSAIDSDFLACEGDCLGGVRELVDLVAYDEDGSGATLDALGGAGGVGGAGGLGGVAGAHLVGDDSGEGLGEGAGGSEGEGEGSYSYELLHVDSPG